MRRLVPVAAIVLLVLSACGRVEKTTSGPAPSPLAVGKVPAPAQPSPAPAETQPQAPPQPEQKAPAVSESLRDMLRTAHYLMLDGKVDDAISLLTQVRQQQPHVVVEFPEEKLQLEPTAGLALCYEMKGRWGEALRLWEEELQAHPDAQEPPDNNIARCRQHLAAEKRASAPSRAR